MHLHHIRLLFVCVFLTCTVSTTTAADANGPATAPKPVAVATDQPAQRLKNGTPDPWWVSQHEAFLKRGKEGPIGVLFLGDSITALWTKAKDVWDKHYGALKPANFGISGDTTQMVLWRIANGELDGIDPKVVVLMIGTNNIGSKAEDIIKGDEKIIAEIHAKLPKAKLLLLAIFPRAADAKNPLRDKIITVNKSLAKLDDGKLTRYLDIGAKFLDDSGTLTKEIMPDALHPSPKGYAIWAEAMQPLLDEMMK